MNASCRFALVILTLAPNVARAGWDEVRKIVPADVARSDGFGISVALSGGRALIGSFRDDLDTNWNAGSAYLLELPGASRIRKFEPDDLVSFDEFGFSVALRNQRALVGSPGDDTLGYESGSAHLFNTVTGERVSRITPADLSAEENFGWSVALSDDRAIVGCPLDTIDNRRGRGSVYLYDATSGAPLHKLVAADGKGMDQFGKAVAIEGRFAVVGSPYSDNLSGNEGAAYVFDTHSGQQTAKLMSADSGVDDLFGSSVAISGNLAVVGSPLHDSEVGNSGCAYVYDLTTGRQISKLQAADPSVSAYLGQSVSISDGLVVVSAHLTSESGRYSGSAYVFDALTGVQVAKLLPSDGKPGQYFGNSVAIDGNTILVGSWMDNSAGTESGSAYLYARDLLSAQNAQPLALAIAPGRSATVQDLVVLSNVGGDGSVINVLDFGFAGEGAGLFDLADFAPTALVAGADGSVAFDLLFRGSAENGEFNAVLTLITDSGEVNYAVRATVAPEPMSALLAMGCFRRRRR